MLQTHSNTPFTKVLLKFSKVPDDKKPVTSMPPGLKKSLVIECQAKLAKLVKDARHRLAAIRRLCYSWVGGIS